jgi:type I restriction enzyme M protein
MAQETLGLTQQNLESRLWAAANSLRGPVDPSDFKAYIFPLLFFKRVTDAWDDEHAQAVADHGSDVTSEVEADYHRFQLPDGCHWRDLRRRVDFEPGDWVPHDRAPLHATMVSDD